MDVIVALLIVVGSLAMILAGCAWLALRVRRSSVGARLIGPIDEIYHPGAHRSRQEIHMQDQRMEAPSSIGPPRGRHNECLSPHAPGASLSGDE
ncbi:hypothetical protein OG271_11985 [Micromonospora rifamycinica]|uniref:hypothetical protein n=1 Tax=Micromonospora rifamycinica TaxID=291594 RepID=UPI002E2D7C56|nr:hypothetical protein [Micromonospora rifamycinica]